MGIVKARALELLRVVRAVPINNVGLFSLPKTNRE